MNTNSANSNPVNETVSPQPLPESRCQKHTRNGRCRMPIFDSASGLCTKHAAAQQKNLDQADLAATLIGDNQEFRSAVAINHSLGELYKLQARNKITPRRAAVMTYTANLLLRTLPAIEKELHPEDEPFQIDFGDLPRPQRDWPKDNPEPKVFSGIPGLDPMPTKKTS
jgi:hypothetical protein